MYAKTTCSLKEPQTPYDKPRRFMPYRNPWCDMLGCCGTDKNVLHFYYPLIELQREIDLLTATLGGNRADENSAHKLDLINMTRDENPQFMSFIKSAMSRVFQAIGKYTKHVECAYLFDEGHPTIKIDTESDDYVTYMKGQYVCVDNELYMALEDGDSSDLSELDKAQCDFRHSVHYVIQWPINLNPNFIPPLDQALFDALKYYVIAEWLHMVYPSEEEYYRLQYAAAMDEVRKCCTRLINVVVDRIPRVF